MSIAKRINMYPLSNTRSVLLLLADASQLGSDVARIASGRWQWAGAVGARLRVHRASRITARLLAWVPSRWVAALRYHHRRVTGRRPCHGRRVAADDGPRRRWVATHRALLRRRVVPRTGRWVAERRVGVLHAWRVGDVRCRASLTLPPQTSINEGIRQRLGIIPYSSSSIFFPRKKGKEQFGAKTKSKDI